MSNPQSNHTPQQSTPTPSSKSKSKGKSPNSTSNTTLKQSHKQKPAPSSFTKPDLQIIYSYLSEYHHPTVHLLKYFSYEVVIGGHVFPSLEGRDAVMVDKDKDKCIEMPSTLNNFERRDVHGIAGEVGLFSCSIGRKDNNNSCNNNKRINMNDPNSSSRNGTSNNDNKTENANPRILIISRTQTFNGFVDQVALSMSTSTSLKGKFSLAKVNASGLNNKRDFHLNGYVPWFYKRDVSDVPPESDNTNAILKKNANKIRPSECIRDTIDDLNINELIQNHGSQPDLSNHPPINPDKVILVDTLDKLVKCAIELEEVNELSFDLEMHNFSSTELGLTCLIQLSTFHFNYIIDPLASTEVWNSIGLHLSPIFMNASVVKIGQAVGGMDINALHRDFGITVVNLFDTFTAATLLRLPHKGLARIHEYYGLPEKDKEEYIRLKGMYQCCDWRSRPISLEMARYGVMDVHYLRALRGLMMRDLCGELWDFGANHFHDFNMNSNSDNGGDGDGESESVEERNESKTIVNSNSVASNLADYQDARDENGKNGYGTPPEDEDDEDEDETDNTNTTENTELEMIQPNSEPNHKRKRVYPLIPASQLRTCKNLLKVIEGSNGNCLRLHTERDWFRDIIDSHYYDGGDDDDDDDGGGYDDGDDRDIGEGRDDDDDDDDGVDEEEGDGSNVNKDVKIEDGIVPQNEANDEWEDMLDEQEDINVNVDDEHEDEDENEGVDGREDYVDNIDSAADKRNFKIIVVGGCVAVIGILAIVVMRRRR